MKFGMFYEIRVAQTQNLRLGYGVRLLPPPYNQPVRSAESAAVLDLVSNGRVEFGTGRSATRTQLEGFGVDPHQTREMWAEALAHIVGCWANDEYSFEVPFDYIRDSGAAVVGDPDRCIGLAKRYQAAGCDHLLCLLDP